VISACKTGSAKRVTAVLPLFPYSRQPDLPYNKAGAPLSKPRIDIPKGKYTFESVPTTPGPGLPKSLGFGNSVDLVKMLSKAQLTNGAGKKANRNSGDDYFSSVEDLQGSGGGSRSMSASISSLPGNYTTHDYENPTQVSAFEAKPGYKHWVAQAGGLVANLLTCAGADQ
jgi:ribose-phosphate pyrophosphokinase